MPSQTRFLPFMNKDAAAKERTLTVRSNMIGMFSTQTGNKTAFVCSEISGNKIKIKIKMQALNKRHLSEKGKVSAYVNWLCRWTPVCSLAIKTAAMDKLGHLHLHCKAIHTEYTYIFFFFFLHTRLLNICILYILSKQIH